MGTALVKARAEDLPGYSQRKAIENKHRSAIRRALEFTPKQSLTTR